MRLDNEMPITFRPGDEAEIWIDDPNPLLFTYTVGTIEVFPHPSAVAARQFAQELARVVSALPATPAAATAESQIAKAEDAQTLLGNIQGSQKLSAQDAQERLEQATARLRDATTQRQRLETEAQAMRALEQSTTLSVPDAITLGRQMRDLEDQLRSATEAEREAAETQRRVLNTAVSSFSALRAQIDVVPEVDAVEEGLKKLGFSKQTFSAMKTSLGELTGLIDAIGGLTIDSTDRRNWSSVKGKVEQWQLKSRLESLERLYDQIEKSHANLDITNTSLEANIIRNARNTREEYDRVSNALTQFSKLVTAIGEPTPVRFESDGKLVIMDYAALINRDYPLVIKKVDLPKRYRADVDDAVRTGGWRDGKFVFKNSPLHPVRLTAGPAFIYSLLKRKEYIADKRSDTDATLVIKEKPKERVTGESIGMMLNIIPRRWDDPFFGGSFQIGVTAGDDALGAAAGVGIHVSEIFSIGVGGLVQRQDRLARGQTPGDVLESAEDLKLEKEFKAGGYFHITLHLDLAKKK